MKKILDTYINLLSLSEKTVVPVQVCYDDDEEKCYPEAEIKLTYNDIQYKGKGTDFLWTDAFADLQTKLPDGVKLACCMTCRHGNMCPFGNQANLLFCTKDLHISNVNDVCSVFDSYEEHEKREVSSFACCDDFVYQSDDYYTYSDFWCLLKEKQYIEY